MTRGWVRLAGHLDPGECAALAKPETLSWSRMAPKVGAITQHGWFAQVLFHQAPAPVQRLGALVLTAVSAALDQKLPDWNEVTWQRYEAGRGHIDPHRDQARYKGLILIVTLSGQAEFTILESRDPPVVVDRWMTGGGDMVLLRGADLGAPGKYRLRRHRARTHAQYRAPGHPRRHRRPPRRHRSPILPRLTWDATDRPRLMCDAP